MFPGMRSVGCAPKWRGHVSYLVLLFEPSGGRGRPRLYADQKEATRSCVTPINSPSGWFLSLFIYFLARFRHLSAHLASGGQILREGVLSVRSGSVSEFFFAVRKAYLFTPFVA